MDKPPRMGMFRIFNTTVKRVWSDVSIFPGWGFKSLFFELRWRYAFWLVPFYTVSKKLNPFNFSNNFVVHGTILINLEKKCSQRNLHYRSITYYTPPHREWAYAIIKWATVFISICLSVHQTALTWEQKGLSLWSPKLAGWKSITRVTSERVTSDCPWVGQPFYQFRCFWGFAFSTYGPTPARCTM